MTEIQMVKGGFHELRSEVYGIKSEVQGLKVEVQGLKAEVQEIKIGIQGIRADMYSMKAEMLETINAQTWKLITFVSGFGTALATAIFFIARHTP